MAEVRLAMVTMGKAMSLWMDTIKEANGGAESSSDSAVQAEAWAGLDRVRDSLLHAAGKDVDDMVKDWVWNDDLDSSRSQASSTVPTPIYESVDPIFTKTPTRASFSDPPRSQDEPNSLRRVDPPPQISIPGSVAHAGPATATPDTTVALNSPTVPPAGPISAPPVHRSFQPLASSSAASSTKPVIKSQSQSHYQPPRRATATVATETVPGRTVSPPSAPAVPPSKANLLRPKADSSGLAGNTAASADPLAGLGVGSAIPRSSMHERKRSSWRNSTTAASLGAGSEPAGSDPLGARS
jgi:TBC1 domain family protein 5